MTECVVQAWVQGVFPLRVGTFWFAVAGLVLTVGCSDSALVGGSGGPQARGHVESLTVTVSGDSEASAEQDVDGRGRAGVQVLSDDANLIWYEATPGLNGSVVSQGFGEALVLECVSFGGPVGCEWTVQMMLESVQALAAWAQDLTGDASDAAVLEIQDFAYNSEWFDIPHGGEVFGPAPDLLINAGASSSALAGVPAGQYAVLEFVLSFDFDGADTTPTLILSKVGNSGWTDTTGAAPLIQLGDNVPVEGNPGTEMPNPVIIINSMIATEVCDDGADNDADGLVDCDDPDCLDDPYCVQGPTVTCPESAIVACDGAGNTAELDAWMAGAMVGSTCDNLIVVDDFTELSDDCGATGSATVTWTATDDCGTDSCSATFTIEDSAPPIIVGPEDLVVECDEGGSEGELSAWLDGAEGSDGCGDVILAHDFIGLSDGCGETGAATVTWTAEDDCENTSTHTATFTIEDTTEPTISGVEDLAVECDGQGNQADLDAWLTGASAADTCGDVALSHDFAGLLDGCGETGAATLTWTATDDCQNAAMQSGTFTIEDTTPPGIGLNGASHMTLECGVDAYVEMGADASDICDLTLTTAEVGGDTVDTNTPEVYVATYNAMDDCGNSAAQVVRTVEVVDTSAPEVTVGEMVMMWPPNHSYQTFDLSDCVEIVTDLCGGELDIDEVGAVLSIYSDEPENDDGDGNTVDDIVILDNSSFKVRVERKGGGNGRVYGVTFEVVDAAGNSTEGVCYLGVPHDQSGDPPVDDGPGTGYAVP